MEESQEEAFNKILKERRKNSNSQGGEEEKTKQRLSSTDKILSFDPRIASGDKFAYRLSKQEGKAAMPSSLAEQFQSTLTEIQPENMPQEIKHFSLTVQACFLEILENSVKSLEKDLLKTCYRSYIAENLYPSFLSGSVAEIFSECYILARTENQKVVYRRVIENVLEGIIGNTINENFFDYRDSKEMKNHISNYVTEKMIGKSLNSRINEIAKININTIYFTELIYKYILGNIVHKISKICKNESELGLITINNNPLNEKVYNGFLGRTAQKIIYSQHEAYQAINDILNNSIKDIIYGICRENISEQNKAELKGIFELYFKCCTRNLVKNISMASINQMKISIVIARLMERKVVSKTIADVRTAAYYSDKISRSEFSDRMYLLICKETLGVHRECSAISSYMTDLINIRIQKQTSHYFAINEIIEQYILSECKEMNKSVYKNEINCITAREESNAIIEDVVLSMINNECQKHLQITRLIGNNIIENYYKKSIEVNCTECICYSAITTDMSNQVIMQFISNYYRNVNVIPEIYYNMTYNIISKIDCTFLCSIQSDYSLIEGILNNFFLGQIENYKLEEKIVNNLFIREQTIAICNECLNYKTIDSVLANEVNEALIIQIVKEVITTDSYNAMLSLLIEDDLIKTTTNKLIEQKYLTQLVISNELCQFQFGILEIVQTSAALALVNDELAKDTCSKEILPDIIKNAIKDSTSEKQFYYDIEEDLINIVLSGMIRNLNKTSYELSLAKQDHYEIIVNKLCYSIIRNDFECYMDILKDFTDRVADKMTKDFVLAQILLTECTNNQIKSMCNKSLDTSLALKSYSESIISSTAVGGAIASSYGLASLAFESAKSSLESSIEINIKEIYESMVCQNNINCELVNNAISSFTTSGIYMISLNSILCNCIGNNNIDSFTNALCLASQNNIEVSKICAEEFINASITKISVNTLYKLLIAEELANNLINQLEQSTENEETINLATNKMIFYESLDIQIKQICKEYIDTQYLITLCSNELIDSMTKGISKITLYPALLSLEESKKIECSIAVQETYSTTINTFYKTKGIWRLTEKFFEKARYSLETAVFNDLLACQETTNGFIENEINNTFKKCMENNSLVIDYYDSFITSVSQEKIFSIYLSPAISNVIYEESSREIINNGVSLIYEKYNTHYNVLKKQNAEGIIFETSKTMTENIEIDCILCIDLLTDFIQDQIKNYCLTCTDMGLTVVCTSDDFICSAINEICNISYDLPLISMNKTEYIEKIVIEQNISGICECSYTRFKLASLECDEMIAFDCEKNIRNSLNNYIFSSELLNKSLLTKIINEEISGSFKEYKFNERICKGLYDVMERKAIMSICKETQMNHLVAKDIDLCTFNRVLESNVKGYTNNSIISYIISEKCFDDHTLSFINGILTSQTISKSIYANILNDLLQEEINTNLVPVKIYEALINRSIGERNTSTSKKPIQGFVGKISENAHSIVQISEQEYIKALNHIVLECMCKPCLKRAYLYKKNAITMTQDIYTNLIQIKIRKIITAEMIRSQLLSNIVKNVAKNMLSAQSAITHQSATIKRAVSLNIENSIFDEILYPKLYDCVNYASETKLLVEFVSAPYLWNTQNMLTERIAINYSIAPEIINDICSREISKICRELYVTLRFTNAAALSIIDEICKRKTRRAIQTIFTQEHYAEKHRQILLTKFEVQTEKLITRNCENSIWEFKISSQFSDKIQISAIKSMLEKNIIKSNLACIGVRDSLIENAEKDYCKERIEKTIKNKEVAVEIYGKFIERMTRTTARFSVEAKKNSFILAKNIRDKYYLKWITEQSKAIRESQFKNSVVTNAVYSYLVRENIKHLLNEEKQNKKKIEFDKVIAQEVLNKFLRNITLNTISRATLINIKIRDLAYSKLVDKCLHELIREVNQDYVASELILENMIMNETEDYIIETQVIHQNIDKCITDIAYKGTKDIIKNQIQSIKASSNVATSLILNANLAFCCKIANKQLQESKTAVNVKNNVANDILKSIVKKNAFSVFLKMLASNLITKNFIENQKKIYFNKIRTGCYLKASIAIPIASKLIAKYMRNICSDSIDEASENEMLMLDADDHPATTTEIRKKPMMPSKSLKKPAPSPALPQKRTPAPTIKIVKSPSKRISQGKPEAKNLGNALKSAIIEKQIPATQTGAQPKVSIKKVASEPKEESKENIETINQALFKLSNTIERKLKSIKLELKPTITTHKVDQVLKQVNTTLLNGLKNNWNPSALERNILQTQKVLQEEEFSENPDQIITEFAENLADLLGKKIKILEDKPSPQGNFEIEGMNDPEFIKKFALMKEIEELENAQVDAEELVVNIEKMSAKTCQVGPSNKKKLPPKQIKDDDDDRLELDLTDLMAVNYINLLI